MPTLHKIKNMEPLSKIYDVIIIGTGAAGLTLALRLPSYLKIALFAKQSLTESNTLYAQGGISAVLDAADSIDAHIRDTQNAGAGICDPSIVRLVVEQGPKMIDWLIEQGVNFTQDTETNNGHYKCHLTREGGHSHRRVAHVDDATGRVIETTLLKLVQAKSNITLFEQHIAVDLVTARRLGIRKPRCHGVYILNKISGKIATWRGSFIVLATGGASKVYRYTTNPDVTTGDGIAMAYRAGCRVANMEFMQFHPTCLYHYKAKSFLISEALRGEGGQLILPDGTRFMPKFDPRAELAPRDIVARAIDHEIKRLGIECVYLDISHRPSAFIKEHFPTIYSKCLEVGIDITQEPIPVVPSAHYTCGGIMTDSAARCDLENLYAIGEAAYTGLHGANRMASNSLLECVVLATQAARDIQHRATILHPIPDIPDWDESRVTDSDEEVMVTHNWGELRRLMWDYVGIVRTSKRLARAKRRVRMLRLEILEYYSNFRVSSNLIELRNLVDIANLIITSAQQRKESRGLHYMLDFPESDPYQQRPTELIPDTYIPSKK